MERIRRKAKKRGARRFGEMYTRETFLREAGDLLVPLRGATSLEHVRERLFRYLARAHGRMYRAESPPPEGVLIRSRDCVQALSSMVTARADAKAGFSVAQALWDLAEGRPRPDLEAGFYAEMIHLVRGLEQRSKLHYLETMCVEEGLEGRAAARRRSAELDELWRVVRARMDRYEDGLSEASVARRAARRAHILRTFGATEEQWASWQWQMANVITDPDHLALLVNLTGEEHAAVARARAERLPFGVTPYYASLMDEFPSDRDRAVRAQVLPPPDYVERMVAARGRREHSCDFMLEHDTSPVDRVTRRYPAICILKPCHTCPQICVYCQRNWEIQEAMAPGALTPWADLETSIRWIEDHEAIREVLVTGGDPFVMADADLDRLLARLAEIEHLDLIRLGTRTPVTVPMRITEELAALLGRFREPGKRRIAVITHIEHPYEVTPDVVEAVDRLRRAGLSVYNQQVFTFYVSRRFETARLRMLLSKIGIDPYYTFAPKGKEETGAYRVPLARLLQERKEEARLLPGLRRTDEAVYNVPGLGKVHLRARQHRDLVAVLPDGSRVYEFHPWEKGVVQFETFAAATVPILEYLRRLEALGEDLEDYRSLWYYF